MTVMTVVTTTDAPAGGAPPLGRLRLVGVVVLIVLTLGIAWLLDHRWFETFPLSILYVVPLLVAVHELPTRAVALVGAVCLLLNASDFVIEPLAVWTLDMGSMGAIAILAVYVSYHRARAQEARARLQTFLGLVAHDLRTPLQVVLGRATLLRRMAVGFDQEPSILALERAARQMERLVGDLLMVAQIGSARFEVELLPLDLVPLLREVIDGAAGPAAERSAGRRIVLEAPESLVVDGDRQRLAQVFDNLVSNALKFSPADGTVVVRAGPLPDGREVGVTVADEGVGIPEHRRRELFAPFVRLHGQQGIPGTGLGLYISRAIVEAHGGRIWAEPAEGRGTWMRVVLPSSHEAPSVRGAPVARGSGAHPDR
jgi:signal transduction histidine kinase